MNTTANIFNQIVEKRRSYREFEKGYKLPEGLIERSLARAIKSPNSSNMQLWEFYRIRSEEALEEVGKICLSQSGAVSASEIVVFVARPDLWSDRIAAHVKHIGESEQKMVKNKLLDSTILEYYKKVMPRFYNSSFPVLRDVFKWFYLLVKRRKTYFMSDVYSRHIPIVAQKSTALAAQTFMLSITAEGYESLPMEGLDAKRLKKYLGLPKKSEINMAIAVGKGIPEGLRGERFRIPYEEVVFEK